MKKFRIAALGLMLVMSFCACAQSEVMEVSSAEIEEESSQEAVSEEVVEEESSEEEENIVTEEKFSLIEYESEQSVVVTFNSAKLRVFDEYSGYKGSMELERKKDVSSVLGISIDATTVEEIYQGAKDTYASAGYFSISEMRESEVLGYRAAFFDLMSYGTPHATYFVIDLENGMCLHNENFGGYSGDTDLEDMLAEAFLAIEEGDGTLIRPYVPYTIEEDEDVFTITFDSGEPYVVDYDQSVVEPLYEGRFEWQCDYNFVPSARLEMFVTDKYASIEEYDIGHDKVGYWVKGLTPEQITIGGYTIDYIDNEEEGWAIFYVSLKEGYALRGEYSIYTSFEDEPEARTIEEVLTSLFGGVPEAVYSYDEQTGKVAYEYKAPETLGDRTDKMYFSLEDELYSFPVPFPVMMENGWYIADKYRNEKPELNPGETYELPLGSDAGGKIERAILKNVTDKTIPLEEALIVEMTIERKSNETLEFAGSIGFESTELDVKRSCGSDGYYLVSGGKCYPWLRDDGAMFYANFDTDGSMFSFYLIGGSECYH